MNKKFLISILLLIGFTAAVMVTSSEETIAAGSPPPSYPRSPYTSSIFGVGIVESSSENIFIGTPIQRIVEKVLVKVGGRVKKGELLIRLEDRDLQAELLVQLAAYKIAEARLKRLQDFPRQEDLAAAEAGLKNAEAHLWQAKTQYEVLHQLQDLRAISQEERNRRRFNYEQAEAMRDEAKANLDKIKEGTWKPDLEIAFLQVQQAKAAVDQVKVNVQRTMIRSPIDGHVLQIKVNEGELPPLDSFQEPLMVLGNTDEKNVKVSINQYNASYFHPEAKAVAFVQGNASMEYPLEFLRIEPYLVNKRNLTNEITEKVDTRVLNVIYRISVPSPHLFIGQQMDVFIEKQE